MIQSVNGAAEPGRPPEPGLASLRQATEAQPHDAGVRYRYAMALEEHERWTDASASTGR